jgi:eukaryotic-like serine/threonine-protein kinase
VTPFDDPLIEAAEQPVVPVDVGEVVAGKYKIGGIIGFGGMATVAAAHHLELDQPVAIKFLHREATSRPDAVKRFLSEARSAARLNSPNVARVLDVGTTPTAHAGIVPYMVMELLEGMDLDGVIQERGPLPVAEAVEYVLQACAGVAEAHALHIIHRDLKPGNLFLTRRRDGTPVVKLLDFGISKNVARKAAGQDVTALTADREMMGSPRYMSPEQVRSSKDVDARTDIWSLGIILHELLAGVAPFRAENIADTLVAILHDAPQPIAKTAPDVPRRLVDVVMRCLQKTPAGRYQTVDELAAALLPFRSQVPLLIAPIPERRDETRNADAGVSVQTVRSMPKGRMVLTGVLSFGAVGLMLIAFVVVARLRGAGTSQGDVPPAQAAPLAADEPSAAPILAATTASTTAPTTPTAPTPPASASATTDELDDPATAPAGRTAKPLVGGARPGGKGPVAKPGGSASPRHRTDW